MFKKCVFALSFLMCASCVPARAVTPGTAVKSSFKMAGGLGLAAWGASMVANSASVEVRKKLREEFKKTRAEQRELAEKHGADMAQFDAETVQIEKVIGVVPVVTGLIGAGVTLGGLYLAYRGLTGFFPVQEYNEI